MDSPEHHTIKDGPYTNDIEVEWTGDEYVSLTQIPGSADQPLPPVIVHISMGQLHALGIEATKRLALRNLPPDAVPLPVSEADEMDHAYHDRN